MISIKDDCETLEESFKVKEGFLDTANDMTSKAIQKVLKENPEGKLMQRTEILSLTLKEFKEAGIDLNIQEAACLAFVCGEAAKEALMRDSLNLE